MISGRAQAKKDWKLLHPVEWQGVSSGPYALRFYFPSIYLVRSTGCDQRLSSEHKSNCISTPTPAPSPGLLVS